MSSIFGYKQSGADSKTHKPVIAKLIYSTFNVHCTYYCNLIYIYIYIIYIYK